jgi:hypothetical protein
MRTTRSGGEDVDAPTATNALPIGTRLERYVIEEVLGVGGFGVTYLAEHELLKKRFAIKEHFPWQFAARDSASGPPAPTDVATFQWALDCFLREGTPAGAPSTSTSSSLAMSWKAHRKVAGRKIVLLLRHADVPALSSVLFHTKPTIDRRWRVINPQPSPSPAILRFLLDDGQRGGRPCGRPCGSDDGQSSSLGQDDVTRLCQRPAAEQHIPFMFYTGLADLPENFAGALVVQKPATGDALLMGMGELMSRCDAKAIPALAT